MIELKLESRAFKETVGQAVPVMFHSSFHLAYKKLKQWLHRYALFFDESVMNDLILFYSLAKKKFLDHRGSHHLLRVVLSIYHMQRKLLSASTLSSDTRHLSIRWMPTDLVFPFSSKPVLGCLIGFNVLDRCELFDEDNVLVALEKHFPELQLVKESYYRHNSRHENLKFFYFEIEKKNGAQFSLAERKRLKLSLEEKIKKSIQKLVPSVFMKLNQEEVYKNVLILSQEISSIDDLPQVFITLDQYVGKEIVFHVTLVQVSSSSRPLLNAQMFKNTVVLERVLPVRYLQGHQIEASLFRFLLPCTPSLLRSDGSLDFYAARQKVAASLMDVVGEFRDYNGGLLIKQQELLFSFKQNMPNEVLRDEEFMETFFHALMPLEKQALLDPNILSALFTFFLAHYGEKITNVLSLKMHREQQRVFISARGSDSSISDVISSVLRPYLLDSKELAYNILETSEGTFFNCVLLNGFANQSDAFLESLQESLHQWSQQRKNQQCLRIALGLSIFSLDPRVGGETSSYVLRLLFEGLTRFNQDGHVENGVAESIEISSDLKRYTFRLRPCFWNDGSIVSAHDFAYAWGKILSPDFKTNFATLFYSIQNARQAKEGKISIDQIGVHVLNDRTLQVDLLRPTPYFLALIAHPVFSPIHRFIDQESPQWSYQAEKNYPCNGPFQVKLNQPNRGYQLVKNPLYWDTSQIRLDQITLTPMDPFLASQAFIKNEIDWIGNPFGGWHSFYNSKDHGRILSSPNDFVCWFVFNTDHPPFNHPKIRQAFALGIDRSELIKSSDLSLIPAYSVLLPRHCESHHSVFPESDVEKARRLLYEAFTELGISKKDFSIQLSFPHRGLHECTAGTLKKQFKEKLGIECQLQPLPWSSFFQIMTEGKFQTGLMNWTTLVDDPIYTLNSFRFSKEGVNFSKWENAEFQSLLDLSEEEISLFQRSLYLHKAETILSREAPVTPLFYLPSQALIRKDFHINNQQFPRGFFNLGRGFYQRR